ncbi:MAG: aldehyde ferredoxin oxidoreductase family protein [Desulfurococcales archaeon]|nr:aldehyde ferredoxin oxidoreductase family protein [Desulfurococcales archaeon]
MWGRALHVNLTDRDSTIIEIPQTVYKLLHGGRALADLLLYHLSGEDVDPLSGENPLIISPGLLTGTGLSTASKTIIAARSPLTGFAGRSAVGAKLGPQIRYAGYDAIIITGKLDEPGVLVVDGEGVRVDLAKDLWGLTVGETTKRLREKYKGYNYCTIGPAGENLSKISLIDCEGRQAGRTGLGAVMGSKKLKAVVVRGRRRPKQGNPEGMRRLIVEWARKVPSTRSSKALVEYGTPLVVSLTEPQGVLPSLNWKRSTLSWCPDREGARQSYIEVGKRNRVTRNPCIHCNRPCSQVIEVENPLTGERTLYDGPEYELVYSLGTNLGFCNPMDAARLSLLADELGFDGISLGTTLSWLLEAVEKGVVPAEKVSEYKGLGWGSLEALARLTYDMAYRRTEIASLLADGALEAAKSLGGGELVVHVKGLGLPAYDARGMKGMALGYAVASRGGDHLTSGMYSIELGGKLWIYENVDPLKYEGKPSMVRAMENLFAAYDNLGVCKFSRRELPPEELAKAVEAALGIPTGPEDVLLAGERTITLERLLNLRWGLDPNRDDTLPPRLTKDPISDGPRRGERVDPERLEEMKREYYMLRGWDPESGRPYRETLTILGLDKLLEPGLLRGSSA